MVLYDSNNCETWPIGKFDEPRRNVHRGDTIFQSLNRAKAAARKRLKREIIELQEQLIKIDTVTEENCHECESPFR